MRTRSRAAEEAADRSSTRIVSTRVRRERRRTVFQYPAAVAAVGGVTMALGPQPTLCCYVGQGWVHCGAAPASLWRAIPIASATATTSRGLVDGAWISTWRMLARLLALFDVQFAPVAASCLSTSNRLPRGQKRPFPLRHGRSWRRSAIVPMRCRAPGRPVHWRARCSSSSAAADRRARRARAPARGRQTGRAADAPHVGRPRVRTRRDRARRSRAAGGDGRRDAAPRGRARSSTRRRASRLAGSSAACFASARARARARRARVATPAAEVVQTVERATRARRCAAARPTRWSAARALADRQPQELNALPVVAPVDLGERRLRPRRRRP